MKVTCHSELVSESKENSSPLGGDVCVSRQRGVDLSKTLSSPTGILSIGEGKKLIAFTLAEVLITIGIIGVVAAMTIPTLMTKIQHKQATAHLKKFYSTMKQMNISAEEEFGDIGSWDKSLEYEEYLKKYFAPFLKGNIRKQNDKAYFEFLDGSIFYLSRGACMDIRYDVNGFSKPNKLGYDQFKFLYCPVGGCDGNGGFCSYRFKEWEKTRQRRYDECVRDPQTCSYLLEYENWEFPKDYPYK